MHRTSKYGYLVDGRQYRYAPLTNKTTVKQATVTANLSRHFLLKSPSRNHYPELSRDHPRANVVAIELQKRLDGINEITFEYAHVKILLACMLWLINRRSPSRASFHWGQVVSAQRDLKMLTYESDLHRGQKQIQSASAGGKQRAINKREFHRRVLRKAESLPSSSDRDKAKQLAKDPEIRLSAERIRKLLRRYRRRQS